MNRREFYFNQELTKDALDDAFDRVKSSTSVFCESPQAYITPGVIKGFVVPTIHSGWILGVGVGTCTDAQNSIYYLSGNTDISLDFAGASTLPTSGNYRWVTVAIRFGQNMTSPQTDGLGVTVYEKRDDSWNVNGTSLLADATATTNNAGNHKLYVVAGTQAATGSALNFPAVPADAVIICDVLITDGETQVNYPNIYYGRRTLAKRISTSALGFPGDAAISRFDPQLLWEIEGRDIKTRFYQTLNGLIITTNAAWTPQNTTTPVPTAPSGVWSVDNTGYSAFKYSYIDGIKVESKYFSDTGTPWTDAANSTSGWDSLATIVGGSFRSTFASISGNGDVAGKGVITGYVSLTGTAPALGAAIQFPRQFTATPSSVTFGAAGPGEVSNANTSSVAAANLSKYGCDFNVIPITPATTVTTQRVYTATL